MTVSTAEQPSEPAQLALRPPPPIRLIPVPPHIALPTSFVFGNLSRLRGKRAMHPEGVVTEAALAVDHTGRIPPAWRELDGVSGVARFSKSIGLPGRVPDVLGLALRFGGQDLLLASALGPRPLLQHLMIPAAGFDATLFSSLLPHRVGEHTAIIQARVPRRLPEADSYLDAVRKAPVFTIELTAVGLLGGTTGLGVVTIGAVLEGDEAARVRFDPWRTGGGLPPAGPFQRWRAAAYAASRNATSR